MQLKFKHKIMLLPTLAGVGAAVVLVVTMVLGQRSANELRRIETGHYPSIELSRTLESSLASLQRSLQDAVSASDSARLAESDSIAADMRGAIDEGRKGSSDAGAALERLRTEFDAYYTLASGTSRAMIRGELDEQVMAALPEMTERYSALNDTLSARTERDQAAIGAAFRRADESQRTTMYVVMAVLGVMVVALGFLSFWVRRGTVGVLADIARAAGRIAVGDVEQAVTYRSRDEIGAVADAFRQLVDYLRSLSSAADGLARGDLTAEIAPRSEQDVLSRNMQRAAETLRSLVGETNALIHAARAGNLSERGDADGYQGVYAELVSGTNAMLDSVAAPLAEAGAVLARVAERDLTIRMTGAYEGDLARMQRALNDALDQLSHALADVRAATGEVAGAAAQITTGSERVADGAQLQASSLEEISSSLQELSSMVQTTAGNAEETRALMNTAKRAVEESDEGMKELSLAMDAIRSSSGATAKIVKTIDEIAFQTNLLALNAAVEAARAGEAGRGFAVVAEEVRSLALRSAEAAKQTAQLIEEAVGNAGRGVTLNERVQAKVGEVAGLAVRQLALVTDIAAATEQQADGIGQITTAIEQMNAVTQRTAADSQESASAATEMAGQAAHMRELVSSFHVAAGSGRDVADEDLFEDEYFDDEPDDEPAAAVSHARLEAALGAALSRPESGAIRRN
ncbi:MAG TPA: methyl-accepting chemotaxis protein [Gemmatimonadales bacterium]